MLPIIAGILGLVYLISLVFYFYYAYTVITKIKAYQTTTLNNNKEKKNG
jgi:hypothetical protein